MTKKNPFWKDPSASKVLDDDCKKEYGRHSDKLSEFNRKYGKEEDCREYLFHKRWPKGYKCPKCQHKHYYANEKRKLYQCRNSACKYQCSLTSRTVFDKSRVKLVVWFKMIFLVIQNRRLTTKKLQKYFKIRNYKTVWRVRNKIEDTAFQKDAFNKLFGLISERDLKLFQKKNKSRREQKNKIIIKTLLNECDVEKMVRQLSSKS